jgi:hypothetical protein
MLRWTFKLGVRKAKINEFIAKLNSAGCVLRNWLLQADAMRTALLSFTARASSSDEIPLPSALQNLN